MGLREDQIQRYSRQILLREIGGVGQERLLSTRVALLGKGTALDTAAAQLAAGGMRIASDAKRAVTASEVGFLFGQGEVGRSVSDALDAALGELNPDAAADSGQDGAPTALVGELPARFSGEGSWVALGSWDDAPRLLARAPSGCVDCFTRAAASLGPAPEDARGVLLGALGALVVQRLVLGLGEPLLQVTFEGVAWKAEPPPCCSRCR